MKKKVGVLFSGGLDSTYLIWKNLKEGNLVVPIYIELRNNPNKTKLEKNRIELIINEFRNEFGFGSIAGLKLVMEILLDADTNLHLLQMPIWLMGMLYQNDAGYDEFQVGYVMNDDAVSYINDFKEIYQSYSSICDDMVEISFPLIKIKKDIILSELPLKYKSLTVSCENPNIIIDELQGNVPYDTYTNSLKYVPCNMCEACKRILKSDSDDGIYDIYKKHPEPAYHSLEHKNRKNDEWIQLNIPFDIYNENEVRYYEHQ